MQYSLPALTFDFAALEPHIDAQTMQLHHDKHHQTYVDKLNAALSSHPDVSFASLEELLKNIDQLPKEIQTAVRNHGGGHSNHSIFWEILSPSKQEPSDTLKKEIDLYFGNWQAFVDVFTGSAANHFGSGWTWLIKGNDGKIEVKSYPNQDSPYMEGATPLLGIDVWEHAYYLKYQNRRPEYIGAFWNIIHWEEVERRWSKS